MNAPQNLKPRRSRPLKGVRILSLALNLPGPAALRRLADMGATCTKINPPAGDAMKAYTPAGYAMLHTGVRELTLDLKDPKGQAHLHKRLTSTDVLITSFRPSALSKLGLKWSALRKLYPQLSLIQIVGAPGPLAEVPGHDLTYQAEVGLVPGLQLPASLFADMGGALMASEATLQAVLEQKNTGRGCLREVALSEAAAWLALPRDWRMTTPDGPVGGAHCGYGLYPCKDGRVAVAALEPHFAQRLCEAAGVKITHSIKDLLKPTVAQAVARFFKRHSMAELTTLSQERDIPLLTMR